jgi:hypothetical protein
MKDTPTHIEQLFTRKLLNLAPEERLAMACRMFSSAKALVRAGISAGGAMSAAESRALVFLRLYGQDFDQADCAKILALLEAT